MCIFFWRMDLLDNLLVVHRKPLFFAQLLIFTSGNRSATHTHNITYYRRNGGKGGGTHKGPQENGTSKTVTLKSAGAHTHSVAETNTNGTNSGVDAGTEDNFPPYFTIKVWRRTA